jgi:hypothetical protein
MRDDAATPIKLSDYRPNDFAIDEIALTFQLEPDGTRVSAQSEVRRVGAPDAPLVLNGVNLTLERITLDGAPLPPGAFQVDSERLTIPGVPDQFVLEIDTLIRPVANTALEGLYVSGGRFCTQCEAEGFRKITYALDRPDAMSRYTVRIEADKARYPTRSRPATCPTAGISQSGATRTRSPAICSRWSPARSIRSRTRSSPCPAARWRWASMSIPATPRARTTRWTR